MSNSAAASANTIVFIDATLPDLATLRAGLPQQAEVHLLPAGRDGMQCMADALAGRSGIEALHLLCHGTPGVLQVGTITLNALSLPRYANVLDIISNAMVEDGQWLIYGCEVARGANGQRFVQALRLMTGLQVAAATHKVGAEELGGSWLLDDAPLMAAKPLQVAAWGHVLAKLGYTFIPQPTSLAGGSSYVEPSSVAIDANGKIVIAGYAYSSDWNTSDNVVSRLNADGSFDTSFGTQGVSVIDIFQNDPAADPPTDSNDFLKGVLPAADGGYFIFGSWGRVTKLTAAGAIDTTWGASGHFISGSGQPVTSAVFDSTGNLYIAHSQTQTVIKLTSAGVADASWGTNGVSAAYTTADFYGSQLIVDTSGIYVAGYTGGNTVASNWTLSKLTLAGAVDTSFAGDGNITHDTGGKEVYVDIVKQTDGKLILTGWSSDSTVNHVIRVNADGTLDGTFGTAGVKVINDPQISATPNTDLISNVALQADGKILVIGKSAIDGGSIFITRLNAGDGAVDATFGTNGYAITPINNTNLTLGSPSTWAVTMQSDGKILVAGGLANSYTSDDIHAVFRFNANGSLDTTFGSDDMVVGGVEANGNLKVSALVDGTMVIDRFDGAAWNTQFYDPDGDQTDGLYSAGPSPVSSGNIIEINGKTIPLGNYASAGNNGPTDFVSSPIPVITESGNTITVVWTIDSAVKDTSNVAAVPSGTVVVTQRITLPADNSQSVNVEWDITNNTGGSLTDVRLARVVDSYLAGDDSGVGYWNPATNAVGVIKTASGIQQKMTITGITAPDGAASGAYDTVLTAAATAGTGLPGKAASATDQDNGYAMEWVIPTLANNGTTTIQAVESFEAASVIPYDENVWGRVEIAAGDQTIFLNFGVQNISTASKETAFSVTTPSGWTWEIQGGNTATLAATDGNTTSGTDQKSVFVALTIPAGVNPGDYNVTLNINAGGGDRSQSTTLVSIDQPAIDLNGAATSGIDLTATLLSGDANGTNAVGFGSGATFSELDGDGALWLSIGDLTQFKAGDQLLLGSAVIDPLSTTVTSGTATLNGVSYGWAKDTYFNSFIITVGALELPPAKRITAAQIEDVLANLKFNTTLTTPESGTRVFAVKALEGFDPAGNTILESPVATFTVTVGAPANAVPTLTTLSTLTGGTEDTAKTITFSDLVTAGNEADADGTVDAFVVKAVTSGTLTIGGSAWNVSTNNTIDATHSASWTPNPDAQGNALNAFTVVAKDNGGAESATPVQVKMDVAASNDAPSFSVGNGMLPLQTTGNYDAPSDAQLQPTTGKLIVANNTFISTVGWFITRMNLDGTVDSSFGEPAFSDPGKTYVNSAQAMDIGADGKIIYAYFNLAGNLTPMDQFSVGRLNADGSLDTSFGSGSGTYTLPMPVTTVNYSFNGIDVEALADGSVLVARTTIVSSKTAIEVVKLTSAGVLDVTFGTSGKLQVPNGGVNQVVGAMTVNADGSILIGGHQADTDFMVVKVTAAGVVGADFGTGGTAIVSINSDTGSENLERVVSIGLQSNGKIIVAGYSGFNNQTMALARLNTDGSLDNSFGASGKVLIDASQIALGVTAQDLLKSMTVMADDSIMVSGSINFYPNITPTTPEQFAIVKLTANGALDTNFNETGILAGRVVEPPTGDVYAPNHAVVAVPLPDGGVIVVTRTIEGVGNYNDIGLIRLQSNGAYNQYFGVAPTLGGTVAYTENGAAVALDTSVGVFDPEIAATGNYDGAVVTLQRSGTASSDDVFSAKTGSNLTLASGNVVLSGTTIGTFANTAGVLTLTFNTSATQALINEALSSLAYENTSNTPPASVTIDWSVKESSAGNALIGSGSTTVNITPAPDSTDDTVYFPGGTEYTFTLNDFGTYSPSSSSDGSSPTYIKIVSVPVSGGLTLYGSPVNANDVLQASDIPNLKYSGVADSFIFQVGDNTNDAPPFSPTVYSGENYTLTLTPNEAPTLDATKSPAFNVALGATAPVNGVTTGSVLVSDLINSDSAGLNNFADTNGDAPGVAITGVNGGTLWYSMDAGANWTALSGTVSDSSALVLYANADTRVYYQPASNATAGTINDALTVRAWDHTGNAANGATGVAATSSVATVLDSATDDNANPYLDEMVISGDYAFARDDDNDSLMVFNVADPANISWIRTVSLGDSVRDIKTDGTHVYLANDNLGGVKIFAISDLTGSSPSVTPVGSYLDSTNNRIYSVEVDGTTAYASVRNVGVVKLNITNPASPTVAETNAYLSDGTTYSDYYIEDLAKIGNYLYGYDSFKLLTFDTTNPTAPPTKVDMPNSGDKLIESDGMIWVRFTRGAHGYSVDADTGALTRSILIDVSSTYVNDISFSGTTAFVATEKGALRFDLSATPDSTTNGIATFSTPTGVYVDADNGTRSVLATANGVFVGHTGDLASLDFDAVQVNNPFSTATDTVAVTVGQSAAPSSVTLNVPNPFTPNDANDTTPVTIAAPTGIAISGAANSAVGVLPKNVKIPLGQFGFTLSGVESGGTVAMGMTTSADFKQFSYFKKSLVTGKWTNITEGVTINNDGTATVKFSLKDGGEFDADRTANGTIVDPGGVGENALLPMLVENTTEVGNVSLLDANAALGTLSFALTGGADQAKFLIDESSGLLSFNTAPNYEIPTDNGDTAANNTYTVQVTVTGSTSGTEVQNLTVAVLNVAEDGDNPNTAPVIIGLRAEPQEITAGTPAALDDIRVADADGKPMTITLTTTNGSIGGLTDADPNTSGIQITGTAAQINAALANATFTAAAGGAAGVSLSVADTVTGLPNGATPITTTAFYSFTATAAPGGGGDTPTDTTPPVFASATVNGTTLVLTYTEATTLDATNLPATSAFTVSGNTVTAVVVNAAAKTVTLTLGTAVLNGATVTFGYTDPSVNNNANAIQDAAGNDAVTITSQWVTNNTPAPADTTAPTLALAAVLTDNRILENTSTTTHILVANIAITDDTQGNNTLSLTGADAASFELLGTALYLKAGVVLDFETQTSYQLAVQVADASLPADTPASAAFTLTVVNVEEGTPVTPQPDPVPVLPPMTQWPSLPDDDGDGTPEALEGFVKPLDVTGAVAGDGNGDGTADALQQGVASVPFLNTPTAVSSPGNALPVFVSLVADSLAGKPDTTDANTAQLQNVVQKDAPANLPSAVKMPLGLISFDAVVGLSDTAGVGVTETFSLYVNSTLGINGYWKLDASNTWVNLASSVYGGAIVTEGGKTRLDFKITDGGQFDADHAVNGTIVDPGAAGFVPLSLVGYAPELPAGGFWF